MCQMANLATHVASKLNRLGTLVLAPKTFPNHITADVETRTYSTRRNNRLQYHPLDVSGWEHRKHKRNAQKREELASLHRAVVRSRLRVGSIWNNCRAERYSKALPSLSS